MFMERSVVFIDPRRASSYAADDRGGIMAKTIPPKPAKTEFRAKVTGRHAITLPAALCRSLHIETGDTVEIALLGSQALLRKAPEDEPVPELMGLLSDYFTDRDDVKRFLEEERRGWTERERRLFGDDLPEERAASEPEPPSVAEQTRPK
jgi:bifunctional DNA-binding transcriptional regulator/antitoxin component of YhaV-PrlF toxin-antitoxin module